MPTWGVEIDRNRVCLPTGTTFQISYGKGSIAGLRELDNGNIGAEFYREDVAFKLRVNNIECDRPIIFYFGINGVTHGGYVVQPYARMGELETLESRGRKLHFKSQSSIEGKKMVAATAEKYGKSLEETAENCNKIEFAIKVCLRPGIGTRGSFTDGHRGEDAVYGGRRRVKDMVDGGGEDDELVTDCGKIPSDLQKGVICSGERSKQVLGTITTPPIDDNYLVNPFVMELFLTDTKPFVPV